MMQHASGAYWYYFGGSILLLFLLSGHAGWFQRYQLYAQLRKTEARIRDIQEKRMVLMEQVRALKNPFYAEKYARELWHYGRPGELVYRVDQ